MATSKKKQPEPEPTRWTAARWEAHIRDHHPSHAAASFALHREEMGDLRPAARVIAALSMRGKVVKAGGLELTIDEADKLIAKACERREKKLQRSA